MACEVALRAETAARQASAAWEEETAARQAAEAALQTVEDENRRLREGLRQLESGQ